LEPGDGVVDPQEASERFTSSLIAEVDRLRAEVGRLRNLDEARLGGISAWCEGMDRESCPYTDASLSSAWCDGWDVQEEAARLRAEIADLRLRLAAETGGEVEGWKWVVTQGERYWTWQGCASEWCVRVFSNRAGWWWMTEGPGNIENTDVYMRQDVLDAMREAVAAYERLRGN